MGTDHLIEDYLRRLTEAAARLGPARRAELVSEIREHIGSALPQEPDRGEAAVRTVLDRLGSPEEIVEAAEPSRPPEDRRVGKLEIVALVVLLVPFVGWLVGTVLVFASRAWSRREKVVGAALLVLPFLLLGLGFGLAGPSGTDESVPPGDSRPVGERVETSAPGGVELVLFVMGLPSAAYLAWQLRKEPSRGSDEA